MGKRLIGVFAAITSAVTALVMIAPVAHAALTEIAGTVSVSGSGPLEGASVTAVGTTTATATTDAAGGYSLSVEEGTYDVTVVPPSASGLPSTTRSAVQASGASTRIDFTYSTNGTVLVQLSGVVRDQNGIPLPGLLINAGSGSAYTDINGAYTITSTPGITYLRVSNQDPNNPGCIYHPELCLQGFPGFTLESSGNSLDLTQTRTLDITIPRRQITFNVVDDNNAPVPYASIYPPNEARSIIQLGPDLALYGPVFPGSSLGPTVDNGTATAYVFPTGQPTTLTITPNAGYLPATDTYDLDNVDTFNVTIGRQQLVQLSGVVRDQNGIPLPGLLINAGSGSAYTNINGAYTITSAPGMATLRIINSDPNDSVCIYRPEFCLQGFPGFTLQSPTNGFDLTQTRTLDISIPRRQVTFNVVDDTNAPIPYASIYTPNNDNSIVEVAPGLFLYGPVFPGANGPIVDNGTATRYVFPTRQPVTLTIAPNVNAGYLPTTDTYDLDNTSLFQIVFVTGSYDGDNVDDATEALAPNNGDGNGDGVRDNAQPNVTSLPSSSGTYVTLAAPATTTLANVQVVDTSTFSPPPQLTLPEGLTDFTLNGVNPGDDVTLTIYSSSTVGVTGYAKYLAGVWSVLPSERVAIFADRVEITLTDGGIGDDDGIANGVVVDPGGIVIQTAPLDTTPPTVTGTASPAANAASWHNTPVTIDWTATDPEPSSGPASDPADTTVTTDGADQVITSGPSCDASNNCATGTTTVSIDTVPPVIDVVAPLEIRVDQALTITCTASDTLSGIAINCSGLTAPAGTLTAGTTVQYTFTATDRAGNTGTRQVAVQVLPPLNTAPTVRADMGVAGLETIGFQSSGVALFGSFADAENNGPYTASIRWTPTGNFVNTIVTGNGQFLAAWAYTGTSARTVTVRICDAAGACGTDTVTVRPNVTTKVTPLAPCVTDRGAGAAGGRYEARWGYRNPAAFAIYVPTVNERENTFTSTPYRRGQPEVFLPGTNRDVFRTGFNTGTHTWRLNGTNVTARSTTSRC